MIEKPKRPKKIPNQDNKQPQTIQELIRRYDLDNTKIYDFLDELVNSLNNIQFNIEKEINNCGIVVSKAEPTEDRKKVWMQKGKNLLNKAAVAIGQYIPANSTAETLSTSSNALTTAWIPCLPNTTYTISGGNDRNRWQTKAEDGTITYMGDNSRVLKTNSTAKYLRCYYFATYSGTIPDVQIEQGPTATEYEAYIEPKIYVLNNNGLYEEFNKDEEELLAQINGSSETVTNNFVFDLKKYKQFSIRLYVSWEGINYFFASDTYSVSLASMNTSFQLRHIKWNDTVTVNLAALRHLGNNTYNLSMTIPGSDPNTYFAVYGIK